MPHNSGIPKNSACINLDGADKWFALFVILSGNYNIRRSDDYSLFNLQSNNNLDDGLFAVHLFQPV